MIWSTLAAAYDADFDALEAARKAHADGVTALLEEVRAAWLAEFGTIGFEGATSPFFASLVPGHRSGWSCVRGEIALDGACVAIWAWVGAPYGGPAGTVRLAVYVAEQAYSPPTIQGGAIIRHRLAGLPPELPGQPYDAARDADCQGGEHLVRLDTIRIPAPFDRQLFRAEVIQRARALVERVGLPVAAGFTENIKLIK